MQGRIYLFCAETKDRPRLINSNEIKWNIRKNFLMATTVEHLQFI